MSIYGGNNTGSSATLFDKVIVNGDVNDGNGTVGNNDYSSATQTLNFAGTKGETVQFTVPINDDAIVEADETFTVSLSNLVISGAPISSIDITDTATGTIEDNDTAEVTIEDVTQEEDGTITFTATLDKAVQGGFDVDVVFADGTATGGSDFANATQTLNFAGTQGETVTFNISLTNDSDVEGSEDFTVSMNNVQNLVAAASSLTTSDTATGTITDNDIDLDISTAAITQNEGTAATATTYTYTITRSGESDGTTTVNYAITGSGTNPADGTDFVGSAFPSGTVTFGPGVTSQDIVISVVADSGVEPDEDFTLTLSSEADTVANHQIDVITSSVGGVITNDDKLTVSISDPTVTEGDSGVVTLDYVVTLSAAATENVTVDFTTADGTGVAGSDYTSQSSTLSFAPGVVSQTISVVVTVENLAESDETVLVNLSNARFGGVVDTSRVEISDAQGSGTITNDDFTPVAEANGNYTIDEGSSLSLSATGTTDADVPADNLTYTWDVNGDGTFGDATGETPSLTWAQLVALGIDDGPATRTVSVQVSDGTNTHTDTATLTVNNVAPTAVGETDSTNEDVAITFAIADLLSNDSDPVDPITLDRIVSSSNGTAVISGTDIIFTPDQDFNGTANFVYEISDDDSATAEGTVTITVNAVNDEPVNQLDGSEYVNGTSPVIQVEENNTYTLGVANNARITIADVDAGSANIEVQISVDIGNLVLNTANSSDFTSGGGTITSSGAVMTLTGSVAAINAAINDMAYIPPNAVNGAANITITTSDLGNTGAGGTLSDTDVIALNIVPRNTTPQIDSVPTAINGNEEETIVVTATTPIQISDPDLADTVGGLFKITVSTGSGTLALGGTAADQAALTNVSTTARSIVFEGTEAQVEAVLNGMTYTGDDDFNGSDLITLIVNDQGNTGAGPVGGLNAVSTINVTINAVNDAPVNTLPASITAIEETPTSISGVSITDVDSTEGTDQLTTTISVNSGVLNVTVSGAATVTTNGTASVTISGLQDDINATLASLSYTGNSNVAGTGADTLSITTSDLGNFGADPGNTGDGTFESDTDSVLIDIFDVNDDPVAVADTDSATENASKLTDVLANDTDVDSTDNTSNFVLDSIVSVTVSGITLASPASLFSVDSNQIKFDPGTSLDFMANGDADAVFTVTYRMEDDGGLSDTAVLTFTVAGENDLPVITNGADTASLAETDATLTSTGDVTVTDVGRYRYSNGFG